MNFRFACSQMSSDILVALHCKINAHTHTLTLTLPHKLTLRKLRYVVRCSLLNAKIATKYVRPIKSVSTKKPLTFGSLVIANKHE
jgi:hypothetical protein